MNYRIFISLLAFTLIFSSALAQKEDGKGNGENDEKDTFKENLFFGGSIWASFGTITRVEVAPVAGYHISPRFDIGIGGKYLFYKTNSFNNPNISNDFSFSAHIFGGSVFGRFVLIKKLNELLPINLKGRLTSHLEYEALNLPPDFNSDDKNSRFWSHNYWVGGGLQQKIGKRAYLNIFILYNLNEKNYQLYDNPTIRIGVNF